MARTRTFLAVDIGDMIRLKTVAIQAELAATGANVKWVDPKSYHITLQYLGELEDRDLAIVCRRAASACAAIEPFHFRVAGLGAFPNLRRPKVLWAGIDEGAEELKVLFAALEESLAEAGVYRKEDRPFTPHLTLGRIQSEADGGLIAAALPKYENWVGGQKDVESVQILASDARRDGPVYSVIGRAHFRDR